MVVLSPQAWRAKCQQSILDYLKNTENIHIKAIQLDFSESHHREATRAQERRTKTKEADEQRKLKKWRLHPGIRPSYGQKKQKNNKLSILKQETEQI